jgi:hypothetical protein
VKLFLVLSLYFLSIYSIHAVEKKEVCDNLKRIVGEKCQAMPSCKDIDNCITRRNSCDHGHNSASRCTSLNNCMAAKFSKSGKTSCEYFWVGYKCLNQTAGYNLSGCPGSNASWAPFSDLNFNCSGNKSYFKKRRSACDSSLKNYRDASCIDQAGYLKIRDGLALTTECAALKKTVTTSSENSETDGSFRTDNSMRQGKVIRQKPSIGSEPDTSPTTKR